MTTTPAATDRRRSTTVKKKKARKPDAADRIASWANGWVDTREFRVGVAARIRRAIKAAVRAAKEER